MSASPVEERVPVWLAAMDAGYLSLDELVKWADDEICRSAMPPLWLADLCLVRTVDDVGKLLRPAWSRHQERDPDSIQRAADPRRLTLGFLWLDYERGNCPLTRLLEVASDVECQYGFEDDSFIYRNLLHDVKYALPTGGFSAIEADAREALADCSQIARTRLPDLPPTTR